MTTVFLSLGFICLSLRRGYQKHFIGFWKVFEHHEFQKFKPAHFRHIYIQ